MEKISLKFREGRDGGVVARNRDGLVCLISRRARVVPRPGEVWECAVEGASRSGRAVFVLPLRLLQEREETPYEREERARREKEAAEAAARQAIFDAVAAEARAVGWPDDDIRRTLRCAYDLRSLWLYRAMQSGDVGVLREALIERLAELRAEQAAPRRTMADLEAMEASELAALGPCRPEWERFRALRHDVVPFGEGGYGWRYTRHGVVAAEYRAACDHEPSGTYARSEGEGGADGRATYLWHDLDAPLESHRGSEGEEVRRECEARLEEWRAYDEWRAEREAIRRKYARLMDELEGVE